MPRPDVILSPQSREYILRGVNKMANLVGPTLGPKARTVAIAPVVGSSRPEILDDGATICRRVIEFPDRAENMGAMIIRQLAWKMHEEFGDGTTSAVVIAQSILAEANRYIAAGGNAMMMKAGVEKGLRIAIESLEAQSREITDPDEMARLITGCASDPETGKTFGEIFDIIGKDGVVILQDAQSTRTTHEYIEGVQWNSGYLSPYLVTDTDRLEIRLDDAVILLTDQNINSARELLPILEKVHTAGFKSFVVIANDVIGDALALLVTNKQNNILNSLAVKCPGFGDRRREIMIDLAFVTGGRFLSEDAGDKVSEAVLADLGRAQRVWCDANNFNILGGFGSPQAIRDRIVKIKKEIPNIEDDIDRDKARERLGKLVGGVCVVSVGAPSEPAQKELRVRLEAVVALMRNAAESGVVPGGGAAYLTAARRIREEAQKQCQEQGDQAMGLRTLASALEAPTRWILKNAGHPASPIIADLARLPDGYGYDVIAEDYVNMDENGVLDSLNVARGALLKAVSGALMAMTTDALILHKKPDWTPQP